VGKTSEPDWWILKRVLRIVLWKVFNCYCAIPCSSYSFYDYNTQRIRALCCRVVNDFLVFFRCSWFWIDLPLFKIKPTKKEHQLELSCFLRISSSIRLTFSMSLGTNYLFYSDANNIPISLVLGVVLSFYGILVVRKTCF